MVAFVHLVGDDPNAAAMRWLLDVMASWPVQAVILGLFVVLVVLAFVRDSGEWHEGPRNRYFVGAVVALGVYVVMLFLLGTSMLDVVVWPVWLYLIEFFVLFGLWLYYFIRFMTAQRSGPVDLEAQRRGRVLEQTLAPLADDAAGRPGGPAAGA